MLIEFRVSNYRSIGEEQVISMVPASNQKDYPQNIIRQFKYDALNTISIYGPNGGGKSNLLKAMSLLDKLVHISARTSSTTRLPYDPFLLREGWNEKPTKLEISFILDNSRYRYGMLFNAASVQKEWLFRKSTGREVALFEREEETIDVSSGFKGSKKLIDAAIEATRTNALFLSTCDVLNIHEATQIMKWFKYFAMIDGLNIDDDIRTVSLYESDKYKNTIREYLISLGIGLSDVEITEKEFEDSQLPADLPERLKNQLARQLTGSKSYTINALHQIYNNDGFPTGFLHTWDFNERESAGTQKALKISGPIIWALTNGGVLIIDEIEAAMHPIMTLNTIELFLNVASNPKQAQLIFATHDTNLLSYSKLRRDQICFAEKNQWESTELYSLSDFVYFGEKNGEFKSEKERPDTDKEKRYFEGRYGAVPALGNFKRFIRDMQWQKEEK